MAERMVSNKDLSEMFLKVRFLAKPKRASSLWSFVLTKSFIFQLNNINGYALSRERTLVSSAKLRDLFNMSKKIGDNNSLKNEIPISSSMLFPIHVCH